MSVWEKLIPEPVDITAFIKLEGRLDSLSIEKLEQEISQFLKVGRFLVLDVKELEFISSSGLFTLLRLGHRFKEKEGCLGFLYPSETLMQILDVTDLINQFTIAFSMNELREIVANNCMKTKYKEAA